LVVKGERFQPPLLRERRLAIALISVVATFLGSLLDGGLRVYLGSILLDGLETGALGSLA